MIIISLMIFCVSAQEEIPDFYGQSLKNVLLGKPGGWEQVRKEIFEQASAVLEINQIESLLQEGDIDLDKAVKAVFIKPYAEKQAQLGNEIDQLQTSRDIVNERQYNSDHGMFDTKWVDYYWKLPVLETETEYLYATIILDSTGKTDISCTFVPYKTLNDATYLFDRSLVTESLKKSGYDVEPYLMLPVSIPADFTDAVLFDHEQHVYALVLSSRPDLLGLENGTVYTYEEFEDAIASLHDGMNGIYSPDRPEGGGAGGAARTEGRIWIWMIVIVIAIASVISVRIIVVSRRKKG